MEKKKIELEAYYYFRMSDNGSIWAWNLARELWCCLSPAGEYWTDNDGNAEITSQEMEKKKWPEVKFGVFSEKWVVMPDHICQAGEG
jgi:hypothetical protein